MLLFQRSWKQTGPLSRLNKKQWCLLHCNQMYLFTCNTFTLWGELSSKLKLKYINNSACCLYPNDFNRLIAAAGFSISPNMLSVRPKLQVFPEIIVLRCLFLYLLLITSICLNSMCHIQTWWCFSLSDEMRCFIKSNISEKFLVLLLCLHFSWGVDLNFYSLLIWRCEFAYHQNVGEQRVAVA